MKLNIKKIAKAIIEDAVLMAETFNLMNDLVNLGNSERTNFWEVESLYQGIQILFLLADLDKDQFEKVVDDYNEGWFEILNNRKLPTKTKEKLIYKSFKKLCKDF